MGLCSVEAGVNLITRMFSAAKTGLTRAETYQQAMIETRQRTHNAQCTLWVPFVVVGEGGLDMHNYCRSLIAACPRNQEFSR